MQCRQWRATTYRVARGSRRFHLCPRGGCADEVASVLPRRLRQADHLKRCLWTRFCAPPALSAAGAIDTGMGAGAGAISLRTTTGAGLAVRVAFLV
jgi:hypothetical protein